MNMGSIAGKGHYHWAQRPPFQDKETLRLGFSISKVLVVTAKVSVKHSSQEHKTLMHESISLDVGCLPLSSDFVLLKKITTLSQFQGHQRLWHRSSVGQALLLPEAQPIQFPWCWGSIKSSHFLQQRDLARPVESQNLRERGFVPLSLVRKYAFSVTHSRNFV